MIRAPMRWAHGLVPRAAAARARRRGLAPIWPLASAVLHVALVALALLAAQERDRPPEPLPPPSYAMVFESGAPERPAEQPAGEPVPDASVPQPPAPPPSPPPSSPPPSLATPLPPPPMPPPPMPPAPSVAAPPRVAELPPPRPADPPPPLARELPGPPVTARPDPTPRLAETRPPQALPLPPPPMPPPPAPARQAERLPGPYLPEPPQFTPAPPRLAQPRQGLRGLDLSLEPTIGRLTPEPQMDIRGAQVGTDWRNAFRRWLEEHKRYPEAAILLGHQGITRIEIVAAPDGRVTGARLVRRSGSVWLDANTEGLFRGARLPPFPPGADPAGVNINLTIRYVLIRD